MTKLSVNINKLATLRNARGGNNPNLIEWTHKIIDYGAEGITVHPRPDERHIKKQDVFDLANILSVEFNIEGYPDRAFLDLIREVKPNQCTLVPDPPHVLTSNAGWDIKTHFDFLKKVVEELQYHGVRTSLFIDPVSVNLETALLLKEIQTDRVELYTESYAKAFNTPALESVLSVYQKAADILNTHQIELNAGHDLNRENLSMFIQKVKPIVEVSIGHALICDALEYGMHETIQSYLHCLKAC